MNGSNHLIFNKKHFPKNLSKIIVQGKKKAFPIKYFKAMKMIDWKKLKEYAKGIRKFKLFCIFVSNFFSKVLEKYYVVCVASNFQFDF